MSTARQLRMCRDAVVTECNATTFDQPLNAKATNRPRFTLVELATLACSVMPVSRVTEIASRDDDQLTLRVDVGLQKHFDAGDRDNADSDPLLDLGEEICEHFAREVLTGADGTSLYRCIRTIYGDEDSPFYDLDHANELECFTGVCSLYFLAFRDVAEASP